MSQENPVTAGIKNFLQNEISAEALLQLVIEPDNLRQISLNEAKTISCLIEESGNEIVAQILVLAVEKLTEFKGHYNCEEAAVINLMLEKIFILKEDQLQVAHCKLFKANYLRAKTKFRDALLEARQVSDVFLHLGESYALACSLLLESECLLILAEERDCAIKKLKEAEGLFREQQDQLRLEICAKLQKKYLIDSSV